MLNEHDKTLIKNSIPLLEKKGLEIATIFYTNMFNENPEIKPLFNMNKQENGKQPQALASMVLQVAKNIDDLDKLLPAIKKVANIHCDCHVLAEHYPIVGKHLINAIKYVLGNNCNEDILIAWKHAYDILAGIFIKIEKDIYLERSKRG